MSSIIAAIIGAIGSILSVFAGVWMKDRKTRRVSTQRELILEVMGATPVLNDLMADTGAARCLLLWAANGGDDILKALRDGKPVHSSIANEVRTVDNVSLYDVWQNRLLDNSYREMLTEVVADGSTRRLTAEMPDGCSLRAIFESNDIFGVQVESVYQADGRATVVYLGIHYGKEVNFDAAHRIAATEHAVNTLRTRFEHVWKTL